MQKIFTLIAVLLVLGSCAMGNGNKNKKTAEPLHFSVPSLPISVTSQEEAQRFMVCHYWDDFPFADTLCIYQENFLEPFFSNYANLLMEVPVATGREGIRNLMKAAHTQKNVFQHVCQLCKTYFYEPNSPYLKEDYYIPVLEAQLESPLLDTLDKERPAFLYRIAQRNRVGQKAEDLEYIAVIQNIPYSEDPDRVETLYNTKAPYLLLFFNNPGCLNCKQVMEGILASELLTRLIDSGRLVVLSLYPDSDLEAWYDYLPNLPKNWINAYNPDTYVKDNSIYDLKAIPTLYLLDSQKTVLLKDGISAAQVEEILK